ncbi:MAG TPA: BMC domain-containing protein [Acidimicrobiia bacterium]|nr:BMC domain-containing protein [Acidimicrobiia bacterium]
MNPAIALLEFDSVAAGIVAGDAMVKRGPVAEIVAGTVHPGHYLVMVSGTVGDVEEAIAAGKEASAACLLDEVFLPDVHPTVIAAIRGVRVSGAGEALGIVETKTVAATIEAADAGVKGATVYLMEVNLADGLGGRAYALFTGAVPDVAAAVEIAASRVVPSQLVAAAVIPQLHGEMGNNLLADRHFGVRLGRDDATR